MTEPIEHLLCAAAQAKALAARGEQTKHLIVGTEHHVQFEDPGVVIQAILSLAGEAPRSSRNDPAARFFAMHPRPDGRAVAGSLDMDRFASEQPRAPNVVLARTCLSRSLQRPLRVGDDLEHLVRATAEHEADRLFVIDRVPEVIERAHPGLERMRL